MNQHLQQLIDLSKIDKEIDAFDPKIEAANHQYESALAKKETIEASISTLENTTKDEDLKRRKNELHLTELSQKLEDNRKKSAEIKTEKEMKSLQLEEEIAKEQITFANEEIERLGKVSENKEEDIKKLEEEIVTLEEEAKGIENNVQDEMNAIEGERKKVFEEKDKLIKTMDQKIISFYEKIRRWAGNSTVVHVRKQACGGCFMVINDKTYAEVIKSDDIITCPHCGRILYIKPPEEEKAEAATEAEGSEG